MKPENKAFTLAELILAMAITAITGLAIVGVSVALSSAYASSESYGDSIQTGRITMDRLRQYVRGAKLVLHSSDANLVIWRKDDNDNGRINISEVTQFFYDASTRQLSERLVAFPDSMPAETKSVLDVEVALSTALASTTYLTTSAGGYGITRVLADDVGSFLTKTDAAPPFSKLVEIQLNVGGETQSITLRSAVALRADMTGQVGEANGQYVLTGETTP